MCADPKELRRVLSNIVENAIKYTPDGGRIVLSAREEDSQVSINVTDNGRGIPPEDMPILFDKFHRGRPAPQSAAMGDGTTNAEFLEDADVSGVGLGLIPGTKRDGADGRAHQRRERSRTRAALSSCICRCGVTEDAINVVARSTPMAKQLLVVDDDPGLLLAVSETLRAEGYEVQTARRGS